MDTKAKTAYDYISAKIETGEFPPGMMLVERQLCEQLGISRSPVRTALTQLANEGELVKYVPKQGMCVSELTSRDVGELYDLRVILDAAAVERFIANASMQEIVGACRLYQRMRECYEAGDMEGSLPSNSAAASGGRFARVPPFIGSITMMGLPCRRATS